VVEAAVPAAAGEATGEPDPLDAGGGAVVGNGVGLDELDELADVDAEPDAGVSEFEPPHAAKSVASTPPEIPKAVPRCRTSRRESSDRNAARQNARKSAEGFGSKLVLLNDIVRSGV
jgi:hypothetical protein